MKEILELDATDIEKALADHFARLNGWWRAEVTLEVVPEAQNGARISPATVSARIQRLHDTSIDPY